MAKEASVSSANTIHTLYVDTNLDTHLAMVVAEEDTIAELKQKISFAHHCCFPQSGEIVVLSLKVRRKGCFYHLIDTMLVKNAFDGVSKSWVLHAEAALKQVISTEKPLYLEAAANIKPELLRGVVDDPSTHMDGNKICAKRVSENSTADLIQDGSGGLVNELGGASGSKLEGREDASDKAMVGGGGKIKKRKKHRAEDVNKEEMNLEGVEFSKPLDSFVAVETEVPRNKKRKKSKKDMNADSKTQVHNNDAEDTSNFGQTFNADGHSVEVHKKKSISKQTDNRQILEASCGGDQVGSAGNNMVEVGKVLSQNDDPKMIPEMTKSMLSIKDLDVSAKSIDATVNMEAQNPSDTRKKKVKKIKNIESKNNVSAAQLENMAGAGETLLVQGHPGVEPQKGDAILSETEGVNASIMECLNTPAEGNGNNDCQGSEREDTSQKKAKIEVQVTTENIDDKLKSVKSIRSTSNTITDQEMIQQVEPLDPSGIRKRKAKKTKKFKDKNNISTCQVEHVEGAVDALLVQNHSAVEPEKEGIILSDTEGLKVSKLEHLSTLAEGSVNNDYQGSGHEGTSPQKAKIAMVRESRQNSEDKVNWISVKPPPSTSNTVNDQGMKQQVEARDSSDIRKKKAKKTKKSDAKNNVSVSQLENVEGAGDTSLVPDHPGVEPQKGDTLLPETEGVNAPKVECLYISAEGSVNDDYQVHGHLDTSPEKAEVARIPESTDNIEDTVARNPVKPPPSTSYTITDPGIRQEVDITEDLFLSTKENEEVEKAMPKKRRKSKSKSKKDNPVKQSVDITPDAEHDVELRTDSFCLSQLANNESHHTASDALNCNVGGEHHVSRSIDESKDKMEVPKSDGNKVDLGDHFVPRNGNHELVTPVTQLVEKDTHQRKHGKELKGKKKTEMHNVDSAHTTSDLGIPEEPVKNQLLGMRTRSGSSEISELQKIKTKPISREKAAVAGKVKTTLDDKNKTDAFPNKVSRKRTVDSAENIRPQRAIQPRYRVAATKPHSKKTGEAGTQKGKNLLAASDTIFAHSSSGSSAGNVDTEKINSDASTMSPSDTSSSSDQSVGEGLNSPRNGSYGRKSEENGGQNSIKPQNTAKNMDLDSILRSTRSYKKAKLTASQSQQDETDGEAIQFDLESRI